MQGRRPQFATLAVGIVIGMGVTAALAVVGSLVNNVYVPRFVQVAGLPPAANHSMWFLDGAYANLVPMILIIAIPVAVLVIVVKRIAARGRKGNASRSGGMPDDDARIIQELHQGLERMDRRIESLETIILEQRSSNTERLRH